MNRKRFASMLLSVAMVLNSFPLSVFAAETECTHHTEHTADCGYVAAEGNGCHYECADCAAPTCTCETDDPAYHATNCPAYVAPENPECFCVEKCTEPNLWCDVCGFDVTACEGGGDEGVPYAEYNLWVGGVRVTSDNASNVFSDGKVSYTPAEGETPATLTLNGYTYEGPSAYALYYNGGGELTLVLNGENSVTRTAGTGTDTCVYVVGNLSIEGGGSLTAEYTATTRNSDGVWVSGNIEVSGACSLTGIGSNIGVRATGDITVSGNSSLIVTAGTAVGTQSAGVQTMTGSITVSDNASLEATSGEAQWSYGVNCPSVTVSGNGKLTATGGTVSGDNCESIGVNSVVTVTGGSLNATGGTATNGISYGVRVSDWNGSISVNGGTVEAQGNDRAFDVTPNYSAETHAVYDETGAVIENPVWTNLTYAKIAEKPTKYAITISDSANGTVTAEPTTATEGETVTLTVTPAEGFELKKLTVDGEDVTTQVVDNKYTFTMPASAVTINSEFGTAAIPEQPVVDTPSYEDDSDDEEEPKQETIKVPVSGDKTSTKTEVTVSGATATVEVPSEKKLNQILDNPMDSGSVEIDLSGLDKDIEKVNLPLQLIEKVAEEAAKPNSKLDSLEVKLPSGSVVLDARTLQTIAEEAESDTIRLVLDKAGDKRLNEKQKAALKGKTIYGGYEAYLYCVKGQKRISDFEGGEATLSIPFKVPAGKSASGFSVWYISDSGKLTRLPTWYDGKNISWSVGHFSDFVILYDANSSMKVNPETGIGAVPMDALLLLGAAALMLKKRR